MKTKKRRKQEDVKTKKETGRGENKEEEAGRGENKDEEEETRRGQRGRSRKM